MQDLVNHNGNFHQTLCGRSVSSSGDGNDGTTSGNSNLLNRSMTLAPLGLLAACRFLNSTWPFLKEINPMEVYGNWRKLLSLLDGAGDSSRNAQCSQLNYNTTNQPGK